MHFVLALLSLYIGLHAETVSDLQGFFENVGSMALQTRGIAGGALPQMSDT